MKSIYVLTSLHHEHDVTVLGASFSEKELIVLANKEIEESIEIFNPDRLDEWRQLSEDQKFHCNNEFINANEDGDYGDFCEYYEIGYVEVMG